MTAPNWAGTDPYRAIDDRGGAIVDRKLAKVGPRRLGIKCANSARIGWNMTDKHPKRPRDPNQLAGRFGARA